MALAYIIRPGSYYAFEDEASQIEKCKEWGLLSDKSSKTKSFLYKGNGMNVPCSLVGYVDPMTAVIEFEDKQLHCIHPSYLKEMQASNFGQRFSAAAEESSGEPESADLAAASPEETAPAEDAGLKETKALKPPKAKAGKEKPQKFQLPEEKVKMTATVKEFTTIPNNFSDNDDEVVIYEAVSIADPETELGSAWSSHSATLKKLELEIGDTLTFEAKIAKKKLTRHPVPYKINNPSKIQKKSEP